MADPTSNERLTAEIADLIEQGAETRQQKAERILKLVRRHDGVLLRKMLERTLGPLGRKPQPRTREDT